MYSNEESELTDRCKIKRTTILYVVVLSETENWWRYGPQAKSMTLSQSVQNRYGPQANDRYVLRMCGLRDLPSQTRLIEFEGIENVQDLANYTDAQIDTMADRNSKRTPVGTRVQMGLARTKAL